MNFRSLQILLLGIFVSGCSSYTALVEHPISTTAKTHEQRAFLRSVERESESPLEEIGRFIDAADAARLVLVDDPYNPEAQSDYSFAVARVVEVIRKNDLMPWKEPLTCYSSGTQPWTVTAINRDPRTGGKFTEFKVLPNAPFIRQGNWQGTHTVKPGVGAPIVISTDKKSLRLIAPTLPDENDCVGMTAVLNFDGRDCQLELVNPRVAETAEINGKTYPLAAEYVAPISIGGVELETNRGIGGALKPDQFKRTARLGQLSPYDPEKIPVLFIHGLGNSVKTWMPAIHYLNEDPVIRERYQFIFFSYPSTLPYPASAAILREQLDGFNHRYSGHKDLVVVGHSMGGMISRLLMTNSGMQFWNALYPKPPAEMPFTPETRETLEKTLIFKSRKNIARIIFASASHRGSFDATNRLGRIGAKLLGNPIMSKEITDEALQYVRKDIDPTGERTIKRQHIPNAIDVLDPTSPFLLAANKLPLDRSIPFHSIMGDRGRGGNLSKEKPQSTDGIVPYWSSHLDGAVSEIIIPSGHWTPRHPAGKAEIKRILLEHLKTAN